MTAPASLGAMSSSRVILSELLSSRARLRFPGLAHPQTSTPVRQQNHSERHTGTSAPVSLQGVTPVYAPRLSNDRLLLGLKGSLNEYELDLLRQRSVEARREKARRGDLIVSAPIGYIKSEDQRLEKDPDLRVQQAILLVFRKFAELGSVRQTLMWFMEHGLEVPTHTPSGKTMNESDQENSVCENVDGIPHSMPRENLSGESKKLDVMTSVPAIQD